MQLTNEEQVSARQETISSLFVETYPELQDTAYQTYPGLLVFDAHCILESIPVHQYEGPLTLQDFSAWATGIVVDQVRRVRFVTELITRYQGLMMSSISEAYESYAKDFSLSEEDLANEVGIYVYQNLDSFMEKGTARPSTRLFALCKRHTRFALKKRSARLRAATLKQDRFSNLCLSEIEMKEQNLLDNSVNR